MSFKLKTAGIIALAAVFFILDRLLKRLFTGIWQRSDFKIFGDWFHLKLSQNSGIAFSLPANVDVVIILTCIALVILVYLSWLSFMKRKSYLFFALVLVIVGAYSNLIDRIEFSAVIDYFSLQYFSVFNLADAMIVGGVAMIFFHLIMHEHKNG